MVLEKENEMRKLIIAALLLFLLSGCTAAPATNMPKQPSEVVNIDINKDIDENIGDSIEEKKESEVENNDEKTDPVASIDMSLKPNELGEIMILMYHGIGPEESTWQRTPENFRKDLEYMYQNGYRMISLNDYAKGIIYTEAGYTPIILTFDDGRNDNFNYIESDGQLIIDPDCAIGILEEYKNKYPDFNVTASFFLGTNYFGQKEYAKQKLNWLVENGYDLGNHTYSHHEMSKLNSEEIQIEIGAVNNLIKQYLPDYVIETLALPHGSNPKEEYFDAVIEGEYEGNKYKTIAVLDVGWRPAYSPFDTLTDFNSLYRVTASEINVDNCGIYDYFTQYEQNKRERFISDGNPDVITIPKRHDEYLNMGMADNKIINIYE